MPDINGFPITGAYIADKKAAIKLALELGNVEDTALSAALPAALAPYATNAALTTLTGRVNVAEPKIDSLQAAAATSLAFQTAKATAITSVNKASHGALPVTLFGNIVGVTLTVYNNLAAGIGGTLDANTVYLIIEP
jgi:hypothetical protein